MRTILLALICMIPNISYSQAVWKGRTYSSRVCNSPNCRMCNSISRQLQRSVPVQSSLVVQSQPKAYTIRVCVGKDRFGRCIFQNVTRYTTPTYTPIAKKVPIPLTVSPSQAPTPLQAVELGLLLADLSPNDILVEPGCGDGRWLKVAREKYKVTAIGIEKDGSLAKRARQNTDALVIHGDAKDFDYSQATVAVMYLYDDLMKELVPKLPSGTKIVSYMHEIPYTTNTRYELDEHVIFIGIKK